MEGNAEKYGFIVVRKRHMNIEMLEQWIHELSPFEQKLKEWYQHHGTRMPESAFIEKHVELQKLSLL